MQCHSKEASRHSTDEVGGFAPLHRERDLSSDLLGEENYTQRTDDLKFCRASMAVISSCAACLVHAHSCILCSLSFAIVPLLGSLEGFLIIQYLKDTVRGAGPPRFPQCQPTGSPSLRRPVPQAACHVQLVLFSLSCASCLVQLVSCCSVSITN
jgi:hypothetical protein